MGLFARWLSGDPGIGARVSSGCFWKAIVANPENQFHEVAQRGYLVGVTEQCGHGVEEVWGRITTRTVETLFSVFKRAGDK